MRASPSEEIVKILWLKTELLHPVDKGGKIRTYQMLKALKRKHYIVYLTLDGGEAAPDACQRAEEYCHELITVPHRTRTKFSPGFYLDLLKNLASPLPYFMQKYASAEMRRKIEERLKLDRFDLLVCDFLNPSINVPVELPCPAALFQHNVEAMIWRRHYEVQKNQVKRAFLYGQWQKTVAYEQEVCRRYDKVIAVSAEDRITMEREYGLSGVMDVPTGVDVDFFRPSGLIQPEPNHLVFTGSMDWLPNEDAIRFFTEQILPRIRQTIPDIKLTVVGRNPSAGLVELGRRDPSVTVTGRVDDVRPYMERASGYIIPLRIGGGTRLKVFEAMAMETPLVSTTIGVEGLPVHDGVETLIGDTPDEFAAAVVRVLNNKALAQRLGKQAAARVREEFGWDRVADEFTSICTTVAKPVRRLGDMQTPASAERLN
jgi:polysaccharide biosynthesis protein PslH